MYKEAFERLPERFRKPNNKNLYYIGYGSTTDLLEAAEGVRDSRDIDKAFGQTLDYLGANVGQYRTDEDDELFRLLIKTKIVANLSKGDIPTINEVARVLFGDGFISVEEVWDKEEFGNEPAALVFNLRPESFRFREQTIARTIAAGVGTKWIIAFQNDNKQLFVGGFSNISQSIKVYPFHLEDIEGEFKHYPYGFIKAIANKIRIDAEKKYIQEITGQITFSSMPIGTVDKIEVKGGIE